MSLDHARAVADAVLYEGYLLYPYRASSGKNQVRWQFGVLGPPGAADAGLGEEPSMRMQCLLAVADAGLQPSFVAHLRFLQLQRRQVHDPQGRAVERVAIDGSTAISWDEAVECDLRVPLDLPRPGRPTVVPLAVAGHTDREDLTAADGRPAGHVVRRRWPLSARLVARAEAVDGWTRLELTVDNVGTAAADRDDAQCRSLLGAHLILQANRARFVSLLDPPPEAVAAAATCAQHRCWPVLAGVPGDTDLILGSPIILYDYPEIAAQSPGDLFDATEIDEILTLRVMTMTDAEKAEARATDPRARAIIDRCDALTPEALQQLHGILRDPGLPTPSAPPAPGAPDVRDLDPPTFGAQDAPWWDPGADAAVRPELDGVSVEGVRVTRGSYVRVEPRRRADAQDLFFAGQVARVTAVLSDVDGGVHVALVLVDDPAADLHDWYGRYWYFAPDEIRPLPFEEARAVQEAREAPQEESLREESRP